MVVLISTEPRRVVATVGGGLAIAVALWVVHLNASGFLGMIATVAALLTGGLTVAFAVGVFVEGRLDLRSRSQLAESLGSDRTRQVAHGSRCVMCRRPLVEVAGTWLCATCDQRPES